MSLLEAQRQRHKALGQRHGLGASEVRWGISQACLISGYLWCIFLDFGWYLGHQVSENLYINYIQ